MPWKYRVWFGLPWVTTSQPAVLQRYCQGRTEALTEALQHQVYQPNDCCWVWHSLLIIPLLPGGHWDFNLKLWLVNATGKLKFPSTAPWLLPWHRVRHQLPDLFLSELGGLLFPKKSWISSSKKWESPGISSISSARMGVEPMESGIYMSEKIWNLASNKAGTFKNIWMKITVHLTQNSHVYRNSWLHTQKSGRVQSMQTAADFELPTMAKRSSQKKVSWHIVQEVLGLHVACFRKFQETKDPGTTWPKNHLKNHPLLSGDAWVMPGSEPGLLQEMLPLLDYGPSSSSGSTKRWNFPKRSVRHFMVAQTTWGPGVSGES